MSDWVIGNRGKERSGADVWRKVSPSEGGLDSGHVERGEKEAIGKD